MTEEELIKQLEANTQAINEIKEVSLKTAKYIRWLRLMDMMKLLLIAIPLIAAYIYLPTMLKNLTSYYSDLLPSDAKSPSGLNTLLK